MSGICGLHHIALLCSDEPRSKVFYEQLGFTVTARHERSERGDVILMMRGYGITLELFCDAKHPPRPTSPEAFGLRHLALRVDKGALDVVTDRLRAAGYCPEEPRLDSFTHEAMTFVKDPDGLPIELHE